MEFEIKDLDQYLIDTRVPDYLRLGFVSRFMIWKKEQKPLNAQFQDFISLYNQKHK